MTPHTLQTNPNFVNLHKNDEYIVKAVWNLLSFGRFYDILTASGSIAARPAAA